MLRSQSPAADVPNTHFLNRRDGHYPARRDSVHPDRIPDGITGIRIVSDTHIRIADFRIQRPVQPIGMHLGTPTLRFGITVVNFKNRPDRKDPADCTKRYRARRKTPRRTYAAIRSTNPVHTGCRNLRNVPITIIPDGANRQKSRPRTPWVHGRTSR